MQANLTISLKSATMPHMTDDDHSSEHQKACCRERVEFHKRGMILQAVVSLLCVAWALDAAPKRSILVPLVLAPSAAASLSKLAYHESKRRQYKAQLKKLERT